MIRLAVFALATSALPSSVYAQRFEDLEALEARVSQETGTPVRAIDRRVRLAQCPEAAKIDAPAMGAVAVRCLSIGWRLRLALMIERSEPSMQTPMIKRGDEVDLNVIGDGFELLSQGVAMEDAASGHPVRVKSLTSQTVSRGIAVAPGVVEISR